MKNLFIPLVFGVTLRAAYGLQIVCPEPVRTLDLQILNDVSASLRYIIGSPVMRQVARPIGSNEMTIVSETVFNSIISCIYPFRNDVIASMERAEVCENTLIPEIKKEVKLMDNNHYVEASDVPDIINMILKQYNLKLDDEQKQRIQSEFSSKVKKNTGTHRIRRSKFRNLSKLCQEKNLDSVDNK